MSKKPKELSYAMPDDAIWEKVEEEAELAAAEANPEPEPPPPVVHAPARTLPFAMWFARLVREHKIREHQEAALRIFLQNQGVKFPADEDTYNRALAKF